MKHRTRKKYCVNVQILNNTHFGRGHVCLMHRPAHNEFPGVNKM